MNSIIDIPPAVAATVLALIFLGLTFCMGQSKKDSGRSRAKKPKSDKIAALSRKLDTLEALIRESMATETYFTTPAGRKAHRSDDCSALATAAAVEVLEVTPAVSEFLSRSGAVCDRCAVRPSSGLSGAGT